MSGFTPVASKAAVIGAGTILSILGPSGVLPAITAIPLGEISDGSFDGWKTSTTTATNFDSGNVVKNLGTLFDWGTMSCTYNNVPSNAGQLALLAAAKSRVAYDFTLQLPVEPLWGQTTTGNLYTISAIVTSAGGFDFSQTKVSTCKLTLQINDIVITPGS
ncbi:hypothetical protein [Granulicella sp. dw_53]|uniref:hypothetical protein n=1 Tax=Granulicella sp. dw_53 TaxID=2719792 RepID=UPI001BD33F49|nr:hypothetical protein [Granulicella sp. dw_53]